MEVNSPLNSVLAKKLWNFLRITFFMMRKGLISKRKLIMDMNLMMKRGKLLGKTLGNLMFHHHHHHNRSVKSGYGLKEYEFSCSNSPSPVFFHISKRKHHYFPSIPHFPCINPGNDDESEEPKITVLPKIDYSLEYGNDLPELAVGEKNSPLPSPFKSPLRSPFSVRVSEYSSEEENDGAGDFVDARAEEFIAKFYEQLRVQRRSTLLC